MFNCVAWGWNGCMMAGLCAHGCMLDPRAHMLSGGCTRVGWRSGRMQTPGRRRGCSGVVLSSDRCPRAGWPPAAPVGSRGWGPQLCREGLLTAAWGAKGVRGQGRWPSRDWVCSFLHARGAGVDSDWPLGRCPLLAGEGLGLSSFGAQRAFSRRGRSLVSWSGGGSQGLSRRVVSACRTAESARGAPQPQSSDLREAAPGNAAGCAARAWARRGCHGPELCAASTSQGSGYVLVVSGRMS